jgi:hypothetical protein
MSGVMTTLSRQHWRCLAAAEYRSADTAMRHIHTLPLVIPGLASGHSSGAQDQRTGCDGQLSRAIAAPWQLSLNTRVYPRRNHP